MGYYINPEDCSKEQWLEKNARQVNGPQAATATEVPVVLVRNPMFSAAAICYDDRELVDFSRPEDRRAKIWYMAPWEKLVAEGFISESFVPKA